MRNRRTDEQKPTAFNIGYQGRTVDDLVQALKSNGVTVLIDLRERPRSRVPGFGGWQLAASLEAEGIGYCAMGQTLGGFTCTPQMWCEGCVVVAEMVGHETVCLMCMERDASQCHRTQIAEILTAEHGITSINL